MFPTCIIPTLLENHKYDVFTGITATKDETKTQQNKDEQAK